MSLAAEHGHVMRTRIIDDALHQAGLADAGFPLDHQHRRPPLAELADCSRSQGELGLPPHEPPPPRTPPKPPPRAKLPPTPAPEVQPAQYLPPGACPRSEERRRGKEARTA